MGRENQTKKRSEYISKKKDEKKTQLEKYDKLKTELIEKEYKANLKDTMEQRLFDFKNKLTLLDREHLLSVIELENLIRGKNIYSRSMMYSSDELAILFNYYIEFISEVNKIKTYIPTKPNFCGFIGITTATYDEYLSGNEQARRDVMKMIDDYISGIQLSLAQNKEIDTIITMFRAKTEHKMVEATAPIVVENEHKVDLETMIRQLKVLKDGKSLKAIEMDKNNYIVEE